MQHHALARLLAAVGAVILAALTFAPSPATATGTTTSWYHCNNTSSTRYNVVNPSVKIWVGYNDVCFLQGASVHSVWGYGARHVSILDSTVANDIFLKRTSGRVNIGNGGCSLDPQVGGSIFAWYGHNVSICNMSVGRDIDVRGNDGRIRLSNNIADDDIHVVCNLRYVPKVGDGPPHPQPEAIRLSNNVAADDFNVYNNAGRAIISFNNVPLP